jgi:quinol monooxygenase YgiN
MTRIFVRHRVKDFPQWKDVFDGFVKTRKAGGEKAYQVFQDDADENNLFLIFEWDNRPNAEKFFASTDLKNTMQKAGVAEAPEIHYLQEAEVGVLQ